ncbi:MAG TPA: DUF481 domain-containing protein [Candidatus Polarisedimenticolaceae bacterium]|nr:DUF481 domain-containing protein [Candidatus Polarisedimenticolaceae bacterium]
MRSMLIPLACGLLAVTFVRAEEAPKKPWSDAAEFGLVMTSGNSEGTNFALSNKFKYTWTKAEFTCDLAALRTESRNRDIENVGGVLVVTDTTTVTAENYVFGAKYSRNITDRLYWYVGAGWYRNVFAGIDQRYLVSGGIGYTFIKSPRHLLKGEIGFDGTHEEPVFTDSTDYAALRGTVNYEFKFGEKSKLTEDLNAVENLDTTSAWRANSITAITASMNEWLALKFSYTVIYQNEPPTKPISAAGFPDVIYTFEKTDTILTAALVINF